MMVNRTDLLISPGFLISLSLLVLNDFYLKSAFGNAFTGKISDFAGLFAFTLFWIVFFPRHRLGTCLALALGFTFWKTTYSQPIVDSWNALGIVQISRTIDLSDLIALSILPGAYYYSNRKSLISPAPKWALTSIGLISVFAFTATSFRTKYEDYGKTYDFAGSKTELFKKIDDLHLTYFDYPLREEQKESGKLELTIPSSMCFDSIDADLEVKETGNKTIVSITRLQHHCPEHDGDREKLLAEFEKEFIERLRNGTPQTKHYKSKVRTKAIRPLPAQAPTRLPAYPAPESRTSGSFHEPAFAFLN